MKKMADGCPLEFDKLCPTCPRFRIWTPWVTSVQNFSSSLQETNVHFFGSWLGIYDYIMCRLVRISSLQGN